jgi:hypothetical protein
MVAMTIEKQIIGAAANVVHAIEMAEEMRRPMTLIDVRQMTAYRELAACLNVFQTHGKTVTPEATYPPMEVRDAR